MKKNYRRVEAMLYSYEKNKCEVKNIGLDIDNLRNEYRGINPISYEERISSNSISSVVENEVIDKEDKIRKLEMLKSSKATEVMKISNALETLEERELKIVELKYFKGLSDNTIGDRFFITGTRIYQIRKEIVKKLIDLLNLRNI